MVWVRLPGGSLIYTENFMLIGVSTGIVVIVGFTILRRAAIRLAAPIEFSVHAEPPWALLILWATFLIAFRALTEIFWQDLAGVFLMFWVYGLVEIFLYLLDWSILIGAKGIVWMGYYFIPRGEAHLSLRDRPVGGKLYVGRATRKFRLVAMLDDTDKRALRAKLTTLTLEELGH